MRPPVMTTVASMSPCRQLPHPEKVPSLYRGAPGAAGVIDAAAAGTAPTSASGAVAAGCVTGSDADAGTGATGVDTAAGIPGCSTAGDWGAGVALTPAFGDIFGGASRNAAGGEAPSSGAVAMAA